jgi:hypothetical protein
LEPFLYVGELPPGWDMPLPDSTAVVGSLVTSEFLVQVILEVPGDSEQAVTAVAQGLWATGWRTSRGMPGLRPGGFVLTGMERSQIGIILCDDQQRRHVQISADSGEAGLADVRLDLNSDPDGFVICEGIDRMFRDPTSIFPALGPPPGMSLGAVGVVVALVHPIVIPPCAGHCPWRTSKAITGSN